MKMNAKTNLKQKIRTLTEAKRDLRANIRKLKEAGPETGEERYRLKQGYDWSTRPVARSTHLAYGLLRGREYARIEQTCHGGPDPYLILKALQGAGAEDWTMDAVLDWLQPVHNFVERWKRLDMMCREGKGDTDEADELREKADRPWDYMTSEQKEEAKALTMDIAKKRDEVAA